MKGGAGQYFTPRPLIQAIVDVMRAAGTGNPAFSAGRIASNSFSWHARMLRIVKKLHYLKVTIRATHEMSLRSSTHSSDVFYSKYAHPDTSPQPLYCPGGRRSGHFRSPPQLTGRSSALFR